MPREEQTILDPINHQDSVRLIKLTCDVTGRTSGWCLPQTYLLRDYREDADGRVRFVGSMDLSFTIEGQAIFNPRREASITPADRLREWRESGPDGSVQRRAASMFMRAVQFALARCPNMITDQDLRVEVHFFPGPSLVPSAEASTDENSVRVEPVGVEAEATRDMFDFLLEGF